MKKIVALFLSLALLLGQVLTYKPAVPPGLVQPFTVRTHSCILTYADP